MPASGAIPQEVGTTNRTRTYDSREAVTGNTALLVKAQRSNCDILGFTKEVALQELVALGKEYHLPVMYDLGSGCFVEGSYHGWHAPFVNDCLKEGADLVTFSGDKLL